MLFDGGSRGRVLLHVGGHDHRIQLLEGESVLVAPFEELADRLRVRLAGVLVPDARGKEFREPIPGPIAGAGDERGQPAWVIGGASDGRERLTGPVFRIKVLYGDNRTKLKGIVSNKSLGFCIDKKTHSV